jgi:hypothetical protein
MKWLIPTAALTLPLLMLASCQTENQPGSMDPTLNGFFPEDTGEIRKHTQIADAMAAAGARADATLSKHHFDGGRLNSLGEDKLALMLRDDDRPEPMKVYLNIDDADAVSRQRQTAVIAFLKDQGLGDDQIKVAFGSNPDNWTPVTNHLPNLGKTETGEAAGGGSAPKADAGTGAGSPSSGGGGGSSSPSGGLGGGIAGTK